MRELTFSLPASRFPLIEEYAGDSQ